MSRGLGDVYKRQEDNSDDVTLPDGFTYSFRDPDNADGIVVTPRE